MPILLRKRELLSQQLELFERSLRENLKDRGNDDSEPLFCNDMGRLADIRCADSDSWSFALDFTADKEPYCLSIRPSALARYGCAELWHSGWVQQTIVCGDPRVLYLYWRRCVKYWLAEHECSRLENEYRLARGLDETAKMPGKREMRRTFKENINRSLNAIIPTTLEAERWLHAQGLAYNCVPQGEHWERRFYPWWDRLQRGAMEDAGPDGAS